jgi:hypothetical protein
MAVIHVDFGGKIADEEKPDPFEFRCDPVPSMGLRGMEKCPECGRMHRRRNVQRTECWQKAVARHRGFAFRDEELSEEDMRRMQAMMEYAGKIPY